MLHIENNYIKDHLLDGNFGLEKESLRVLEDGTFSHTLHPFPDDAHIVKDFCENQTEINTDVHPSIKDAMKELQFYNRRIYEKLQTLEQKEYLWLFSNPPFIQKEDDIPVAVFGGTHVSKTSYRNYLSEKYGRYKMTFSGIHVNFSFAESLLKADFDLWKEENFSEKVNVSYQEYKNQIYLKLAKNLALYGWILVAVTAASPVLDSSYLEKGVYGKTVFTGMGSVRCSEMGYWNEFAPVFDYSDIGSYAESIRKYVKKGLLKAPSELYYPIRLKPAGENNLDTLQKKGVNHIELRMFDLNPLAEEGLEEKDVVFAHLLMVWLASTPDQAVAEKDQIKAVQNFKNAAHYDLKTVKILTPDGEISSVAAAAKKILEQMKRFFRECEIDVEEILEFEYEKFTDAKNRYAWKIRQQFQKRFVDKAMELARKRQEI